jgi:tRNA threonylcarbamoyl adenosine modification protein YeaZ
MPLWLAFDAGSPVTSAAVARDGTGLAESSGESRSGPPLLHHIDACLRRAEVRAQGLDGIVVLSGPGSFTGIRIALATALGFRAALEAPVVALSNLAALALHGRPAEGAPILSLIDALREEWFAQEFRYVDGDLRSEEGPRRLAAAALAPAAGSLLTAHVSQVLPAGLAATPARLAAALAPAVAAAASAGGLRAWLSPELEPLYLRAFTPRTPQA